MNYIQIKDLFVRDVAVKLIFLARNPVAIKFIHRIQRLKLVCQYILNIFLCQESRPGQVQNCGRWFHTIVTAILSHVLQPNLRTPSSWGLHLVELEIQWCVRCHIHVFLWMIFTKAKFILFKTARIPSANRFVFKSFSPRPCPSPQSIRVSTVFTHDNQQPLLWEKHTGHTPTNSWICGTDNSSYPLTKNDGKNLFLCGSELHGLSCMATGPKSQCTDVHWYFGFVGPPCSTEKDNFSLLMTSMTIMRCFFQI